MDHLERVSQTKLHSIEGTGHLELMEMIATVSRQAQLSLKDLKLVSRGQILKLKALQMAPNYQGQQERHRLHRVHLPSNKHQLLEDLLARHLAHSRLMDHLSK